MMSASKPQQNVKRHWSTQANEKFESVKMPASHFGRRHFDTIVVLILVLPQYFREVTLYHTWVQPRPAPNHPPRHSSSRRQGPNHSRKDSMLIVFQLHKFPWQHGHVQHPPSVPAMRARTRTPQTLPLMPCVLTPAHPVC